MITSATQLEIEAVLLTLSTTPSLNRLSHHLELNIEQLWVYGLSNLTDQHREAQWCVWKKKTGKL